MITVYNQDRDCHLVVQGRAANNFWSRSKGLIGANPLEEGEGLLIEPCNSVHCFFMSFPIDVVYMNRENQVIGLDREMKPWRVGKVHWRARSVIELPAGTLQRTGTSVGDRLSIQEV